MNHDSVELLKQCNSGCKNGTNSMEQVIEYVKDDKFAKLINDYNQKHIKIGEECHKLLNKGGEEEKDPNALVMKMAEFGTDMKLLINDDAYRIADLLIDGCVMGIKSISKYINKCQKAENEVKDIAYELVCMEQDFMNELLAYL